MRRMRCGAETPPARALRQAEKLIGTTGMQASNTGAASNKPHAASDSERRDRVVDIAPWADTAC